jgi:hypothetical protein
MWWFVLYYPALGLLIWAAHRASARYKGDPIKMRQAEMAIGCALMVLPIAPLLLFAIVKMKEAAN